MSITPGFSIEFPAGALPQPVFIPVTPRMESPFPNDGGLVVPGTAFDIGPSGVPLNVPAQVFVRVPENLLDRGAAEDLRLVLGFEHTDGSVSLFPGAYDATNGLFSAQIEEIGPVAVVLAEDVAEIPTGGPPALAGGSFSFPPPPTGPAPAPPAGPVSFSGNCSLAEGPCFSSGLVSVWVSGELHERYGSPLVFLNPQVDVQLEFTAFHPVTDQPTAAVGHFELRGDLQARFGNSISHLRVHRVMATGVNLDPSETTLSLSGNEMTFGAMTDDESVLSLGDILEFQVSLAGLSETLTIRLEDDVELTEDDGSTITGRVIAHLLLRR